MVEKGTRSPERQESAGRKGRGGRRTGTAYGQRSARVPCTGGLEPVQFRDQCLDPLLAINLNQTLLFIGRRNDALQLAAVQIRAATNPHAAVRELHVAHE